MLVYQLRLIDLGENLEPVFKEYESALKIKEKYKCRNIVIKSEYLENIEDDKVYRIKTQGYDGYFLEDEVYSSLRDAEAKLKSNHQSIVESRLA